MLFLLFSITNQVSIKCVKKTKKNIPFSSAFQDLLSEDCKQKNSTETHAFLKLDKKYLKILLRAKQLPIKKSCTAHEVVQELRAIQTLNAHFFPTEN